MASTKNHHYCNRGIEWYVKTREDLGRNIIFIWYMMYHISTIHISHMLVEYIYIYSPTLQLEREQRLMYLR